jgi:hypothetical protein
MRTIVFSLIGSTFPSAYKALCITALCMHDHKAISIHQANRAKTSLTVVLPSVFSGEDIVFKDQHGFDKINAMFLLVREILLIVPLKLHPAILLYCDKWQLDAGLKNE